MRTPFKLSQRVHGQGSECCLASATFVCKLLPYAFLSLSLSLMITLSRASCDDSRIKEAVNKHAKRARQYKDYYFEETERKRVRKIAQLTEQKRLGFRGEASVCGAQKKKKKKEKKPLSSARCLLLLFTCCERSPPLQWRRKRVGSFLSPFLLVCNGRTQTHATMNPETEPRRRLFGGADNESFCSEKTIGSYNDRSHRY